MADPLTLQFGRRLRQLRLERGLSQSALAEGAEITPEYVSRLERGLVNPSMAVLARVADSLRVEVRDLFDFRASRPHRDVTLIRLERVAATANGDDRQLILRIAESIATRKRPRR
jgi:transcriptional regulator with XRE-family HTH domain